MSQMLQLTPLQQAQQGGFDETAAQPAFHIKAKDRREVMVRLVSQLPTNEFGMPTLLYRADAIPHHFDDLPPTQQMAVQRDAAIALSYHEGFPTTPEGKLLWDQLQFEGAREFVLFQQYLQMNTNLGYRSVNILARELTDLKFNKGPATTQAAKATPSSLQHNEELHASAYRDSYTALLSDLQEMALYHYWTHRARAFDVVGQAAYRRIRSQRAMILEDQSYHKLERMVTKTMARFDRLTDDDMDTMDPLETVKMMKELIGLQRVSVGLPAAGPATEHLPGAGQNGADQGIEVHLRTIAKQNVTDSARSDTSVLLNDEASTDMAQELIIKMMQRSR